MQNEQLPQTLPTDSTPLVPEGLDTLDGIDARKDGPSPTLKHQQGDHDESVHDIEMGERPAASDEQRTQYQ